ncbi:MAG: minD 1 [Firmicutes bacterium]|nr:minD 1 [Bacillota bacterium]
MMPRNIGFMLEPDGQRMAGDLGCSDNMKMFIQVQGCWLNHENCDSFSRWKTLLHFGHCEQFAIVTVNDGKISAQEQLTSPPHAPGVIPNWVADKVCTDIIVGDMGEAAQAIFEQRGIKVLGGAPSETPENLVELYLLWSLTLFMIDYNRLLIINCTKNVRNV